MTTPPLAAALIVLMVLLVLRGFCEAELRCMQSSKAHRAYVRAVPFWQRWLMLRADEFVKDKYSKLEKRIMPNKAVARFHRMILLPMHVLLLAVWLVFALCAAGIVPGDLGNAVLTGYLILWGMCMLLGCIVDEVVHRQFWRNKRR